MRPRNVPADRGEEYDARLDPSRQNGVRRKPIALQRCCPAPAIATDHCICHCCDCHRRFIAAGIGPAHRCVGRYAKDVIDRYGRILAILSMSPIRQMLRALSYNQFVLESRLAAPYFHLARLDPFDT
jgi:hypothetical protein